VNRSDDAGLGARVATLRRFYGRLPEPPRDPFTFYVWEVLSAQTTPRRRDAAFAAMKRARVLTPDAVARAPQKTLEDCLRLAGPYVERRIGALRSGVDVFRRTRGLAAEIAGPIEGARRALAALPHLDADGADRILLFATGHAVMPVDAGVTRVGRRLGLCGSGGTQAEGGDAVRRSIVDRLPHDVAAYRRTFLYLRHHGMATCIEPEPLCHICPIAADCPGRTAAGTTLIR
jgi:endonuclease-3